MANQNSQPATSIGEEVALRERRVLILSQINELAHEEPISDKEFQLRQEYNEMTDRWIEIRRKPLQDPLIVLPPELWRGFLPKTIDEILVLTLVSPAWSQMLLSTPLLWTNIILDTAEEDYLAKAKLVLHLSQHMMINLRIELSVDMWRRVAPIFTMENGRIHTLEILPTQGHRLQDAFVILSSFTRLPVLSFLQLPRFQDIPIKCDPGILERFPSLTDAPSIPFTAQILKMSTFQYLQSVVIHGFDQEMVDTLSRLSNLKTIYLDCGMKRISQSESTTSRWTRCSLPSVTELHYSDRLFNKERPELTLAIRRALQCTSQSLVTLSIKPLDINAIPGLLADLQQFHCLRILQLEVGQWLASFDDVAKHEYAPLQTLKTVSIRFMFPQYAFQIQGDSRGEDEIRREQCFARLFSSLVATIPNVEELNLTGWFMAEIALDYIRHLCCLQSLVLVSTAPSSIVSTSGFISKDIAMKYVLPEEFLDRIQSGSLQFLQTSTAVSTYISNLKGEAGDIQVMTPHYNLSSNTLYTVTTLSLTVDCPLIVDLITMPAVRILTLVGDFITLASDFLEELLLQPHNWPSLERIRFMGHFIEWDVLILMLERRNFVTIAGVKRITSLVFTQAIPYKLLYPLTKLLGGKFADRAHISEYSITAIGNLLWDPEISGCHSCLRMFGTCDLSAQSNTFRIQDADSLVLHRSDIRLAWYYQLPHERLQSSPVLSSGALEWLIGKRERRIRFVAMARTMVDIFFRPVTCSTRAQISEPLVVESHSLDGVMFNE